MQVMQFPQNKLTGWYDGKINPSRPGVYMTATRELCESGNGYAYWNGASWEHYKDWGGHFDRPNFVWQGLCVNIKFAPANHSLVV